MLRFMLPKRNIYLRSIYHIRIVLIPIFTNGYIFIHLQEASRFPSSFHHQTTSLITDLVLSSSMSHSPSIYTSKPHSDYVMALLCCNINKSIYHEDFVVLKTILLNVLLSPFGKSQTSLSTCCLSIHLNLHRS